MRTLDDITHDINNLWVVLDHWKALAINWNIDHPDDQMSEGGLTEIVHLDVIRLFDELLDSSDHIFSGSAFGMSKKTFEVLHYLCGTIGVLDAVYTLHDGEQRHDIPMTAIARALADDAMKHPETNAAVENWKDRTHISYKLTDEMKRLKDDYKNRV